jgi:hypothetical protein
MNLLPKEFVPLILMFALLFSKRVWEGAVVLLVGAMLAPGERTVSAILRVMGREQERQFQRYHRVLNRAVCLVLLVEIPWAKRVWALPFLTALTPSKRYHQSQGRRHKTLVDGVGRCSSKCDAGYPTVKYSSLPLQLLV